MKSSAFVRTCLIRSTFLLALGQVARAQDTSTETPQTVAPASSDRVVVTASPLDRSAFDTAQPVSQLSGLDLKSKQATTLGEALDGEPGIGQSGFTNGASRPIIRGEADNRVRVLNDGTEVFDVSNLSPDHEPSVEPLISQSIEVVRGPATILYGSSAIGGVVNVIDGRIPTAVPDHGYSGELIGRMGYVDFERSGAASLDLGLTKHLVFHFDGTKFFTDDLMVPGYALSPRIREGLAPEQIARGDRFGGDPVHYVPNTYVQTQDFGVGLSYVWDKGYVGTSFGQYLSVYGVPDDPEVDDPTTAPEGTRLDITKRRWDIRASVVDPFPYFQVVNFKINATDYKHREIDGASDIGSTFLTSGFDSRLELVHKPLGVFEGSVGAQVFLRDLAVGGDDAFLQPTRTVQPAGFIFEEVKLVGGHAPAPADDGRDGGKNVATVNPPADADAWDPTLRLQFGGRVEYTNVSIRSDDPLLTSLQPGDSKTADFLPLSASAGLVYEFLKDTAAALTLSYSERAPTAEELYARGIHDATFQYLIGDPNLGMEKQFGVDFSIRRRAGIVTGSLSGFYNRFYDFIDFTPEAGSVEGNRIFDYAPINADFYGGEALADIHFLPQTLSRPAAPPDDKSARARITGQGADQVFNPNDLYLEFKADYVHAEDRDTGGSLPRITPLRVGLGLGYTSDRLTLKVEGVRVNHQFRTAEYETSTPGYNLLNASASYRLPVQLGHGLAPVTTEIFLRGTNLTNEEARNHESFLKDVLPLPGRNILGGVRLTF